MDVSGALSLVQTVIEKLGAPIWMKIESALGVESQLEKLKDTISTVQAVFLDADQEELLQQHRRSHVERNRLQRLKEVLYRADDLIDEIATITLRKKLTPGNNVSKEVCLFFSRHNQLRSAFCWSQEMELIREMLDDIVKDHRHEFGPRHIEAWRVDRHNPRDKTHSVCEETNIIGRDNDKQKVINMLIDNSLERDVSFISIVGIGGLGKTSLAQYVYNDECVKREFPLKMWVCVSDDFKFESVLREIFAAMKPKTEPSTIEGEAREHQPMKVVGQEQPTTKHVYQGGPLNMEQLQKNIQKELNGKKYLLVLDDVWIEDYNTWHDTLGVLLRKGGKGSKVMVTTRSTKVANVIGSQIHTLRGLSDDDSWNLLKKIAFQGNDHHMEERVREIGKEIAKKCANVPLALRVVGSLLRGQSEGKWQYFKNNDLASIKQEDNGILPVLKISYYYLPFYLKSCFNYCAIFPKDYKIMKHDLISLWMAQGFIMPLDGQSLEDIGEEYFRILLERCFFQDVDKDDITGAIISCKMHDLIHDVAKEVAGTEILSLESSTSRYNEKTRHVFVDDTVQISDDISFFTKMKRLRTLLNTSQSCAKSEVFLSKVRYLRVLDLHGLNLKMVPSMISKLLHLRYLDLSHNSIHLLPASITKLYNLQTLKLSDCKDLKRLPRNLSRLVNLRHLDICGCYGLRHMPPGMKHMTSLRQLTRFVLAREERKSCIRRSDDVGKLTDLEIFKNHADTIEVMVNKGVRFDTNRGTELGYLLNDQHKDLLRKFNIGWRALELNERSDGVEVLLQGLQVHINLRELKLAKYPGVKLSSWGEPSMDLKSCFPNLVEITLTFCKRLEHLPLMSQLPYLKILRLEGLTELKYVESSKISEEGSPTSPELVFFPNLERLVLYKMPKLKGWWKEESGGRIVERGTSNDNIEEQSSTAAGEKQPFSYSFPRLSCLDIWTCPGMKTFPLCPKIEDLTLKEFNGALVPIMRRGKDGGSYSSSNKNREGRRIGRLREVRIDDVGYLNSLPKKSFHYLTHLRIFCNKQIECLTTAEAGNVFQSGCLSSLCSLEITSCYKLKSVSGQRVWEHLTALKTLKLMHLNELELDDEEEKEAKSSSHGDEEENMKKVVPWRFLSHSLRHLTLSNLPKLEKLPKGMRHLTSLKSLSIQMCSRLKTVSEEICHLTSLQYLELSRNSDELEKRCKRLSGVEWPKINHIPKIHIWS
ncbi:putative disease resistance protein RGA3 [Amaranthus tricolor]|uniref:putative disease resistance protein RGA3 n=1 Tax=Amaranthus tricolor TaxID=29722 RepID=UPI0025875B23|nr:putative disease resistance protein RGA3 [Amaranthus tricolor]